MKKLFLVLLCFLPACVTADKDDRICLDYASAPEVVEECTPLYGNIICVTKEKTRYWCVLYEEPTE